MSSSNCAPSSRGEIGKKTDLSNALDNQTLIIQLHEFSISTVLMENYITCAPILKIMSHKCCTLLYYSCQIIEGISWVSLLTYFCSAGTA